MKYSKIIETIALKQAQQPRHAVILLLYECMNRWAKFVCKNPIHCNVIATVSF